MPDPAYLANVSRAFMQALREAHALIAAGQVGSPLVDVIRHARELHEIMLDEVAAANRPTLLELGKRLSAMERYLQEH
jgi:hypothetical protein